VDVDLNNLDINRIGDKEAYHTDRLMTDKAEYNYYRQKALKRAKEYLEEQERNSLHIYETHIKPYLQ
jgi:hypothetical protein